MGNEEAGSREDLLILRKPVVGQCHMFKTCGLMK